MTMTQTGLGAMACALAVAPAVHADILDFTCALDGTQVNGCAGSGSAGVGAGTFTLDTATGQVDYIIDLGGLTGNETAAHVHGAAPACVNAGIVYALPPGAPKTGAATLSAQQVQDMIDGLHYVNIHTTVAPGGEIRGQILLEQSPVYAFGMLHQPLGQAQLDASGGTLTVSNIGSSGKDGVSIVVGGGTGSGMGFLPPIALDGLPPGEPIVRVVHSDPTISLDGLPPGEPVTRYLTDGSTHELTVDFSSLGIAEVRVNILDAGTPVLSMVVPNGVAAQLAGTPQIAAITTRVEIDGFVSFHQYAAPVTITPPGLAPVVGDAIELVGVGTNGPLVGIDRSVMLLAALPPVTIVDEALLIFDHPHRALGQAQLDASGGTLRVSNLGSSGKDGVSIDLGDSPAADGFEAPLLPLPLPTPNDLFILSAAGTLQGTPPQFLGEAQLRNAGGGAYEVSADYAAIGSSQVLIEVLDLGTLSGTAVLPGGLLGQLVPGPQGLGLSKCGKFGGGTTCLVMCFEDPFQLFLPGQPQPFVGTELRLLAENPAAPIESIIDFEIRATTPFTIVDEIIPGAVNPVLFGIEHEDIGDAALSTNAQGHLVVSNIGSSGKDGVSIDVGETGRVKVKFHWDIAPLAPGSQLQIEISGPCGTAPITTNTNCVIWDITDGGGANQAEFRAARGIGSSGYDLVAFDANGNPVYSMTGQIGDPAFVLDALPPVTATAGRRADRTGADWQLEFDVPVDPLFTGEGLPTTGVKDIQITYSVSSDNYCPRVIDTTSVTGSIAGTPLPGQPFVVITGVELGLFDGSFRAEGAARLSAGGGHLTVSNIGSSGKDGVSIDLGDVESDDPGQLGTTKGVILDTSPLPMGIDDVFRITGRGTVATGSVEPLGSCTVINSPPSGGTQVFADLTPFNATGSRVEVYDDGTFAGSFLFPGSNGIVANLLDAGFGPPAISGSGLLPVGGIDGAGDGYVLKFPYTCHVSWPFAPLTTVGFATGDEMRIIADGPSTTSHVALTGFDVEVEGPPAYTILGAGIIDDCPADLDGNGSIGFADLNAILAAWGACAAPCAEDLNGDGSVGFVDLNVVLSAWGPC